MSLEFQKIPFRPSSTDGGAPHDLRLYRPVVSAGASDTLTAFYTHAAEVLETAGFTPDDVTLQLPERYEVTVVSKGSINRAVTLTDNAFFTNVPTETIRQALLETLPGTSRAPIPAVLGKISFYDTELGEKTKTPRYLAGFLDIGSGSAAKYVGYERFQGYEFLKGNSGLDRYFNLRMRQLKPAAFRFAAFHDPNHLPDKNLISELMPDFSIRVILGQVAAGRFDSADTRPLDA